MFISKLISKMVGEKRRWRQYKARTQQLPASYRTAIEAIERYLMYFGRGDGAGCASMLEDLVELFEQSVANGTSIRATVGEDPVEFVETFVRNYPEGRWFSQERERLTNTIDRVAGNKP